MTNADAGQTPDKWLEQVFLPAGHLIRAMITEDLDLVCQLESDSQGHPWGRKQFVDELENRVSSLDLYFRDERLAGFLCSWLIAGELQIQNVAVAVADRRQGIAGRLLQYVLMRSMHLGMEQAWLEVRAGNSGAIALYQQHGFIRVDCRPGYYHDGEDALVMTYLPDGLPRSSIEEKTTS